MKRLSLKCPTVKQQSDNTITPSISGGCAYPIPLIYNVTNTYMAAEIERAKVAGYMKFRYRAIHISPISKLCDSTVNSNEIFGGEI